jgi:hypothetical protein
MLLKHRYRSQVWQCDSTEHLIQGCVSADTETALQDIFGIIGRMLDKMPLTDQQKLDLVDPYGGWEIVEEEE